MQPMIAKTIIRTITITTIAPVGISPSELDSDLIGVTIGISPPVLLLVLLLLLLVPLF